VTESYKFLKLSGKPFDIGHQHGKQASIEIKSLLAFLMAVVKKRNPVQTAESLRDWTKLFVPGIQDYAPNAIDEMKGIAEGSSLPFEDILLLNLRGEIALGNRSVSGHDRIAGECTSIGITKERSSTGGVILGQNEDWSASPEHIVILDIVQEAGPSILAYSFAGVICHSGINSWQAARIGNNLTTTNERQLGIPKQITIRRCLEQKSIRDILTCLRNAKRTVSTNHIFSDDTGMLVDVETTADHDRIIYPKNGVVTHANDLLHPDLMELENNYNLHNSLVRTRRIEQIASARNEKLSVEDVKDFLSDHLNQPKSICCHAGTYKDGIHTISTIICEPESGLLHVSRGEPCKRNFSTYSIRN
jgi:isopenicillin-N N-acyltransferase like protein